MAQDTDRLLQVLAQGNQRKLQYDQMAAQQEAQDQAAGVRLRQDAANRIDQGMQFAQQQENLQQARGDMLADRQDSLVAQRARAAAELKMQMEKMAADAAQHAEGRLDNGLEYQRRIAHDKSADALAREQMNNDRRVAGIRATGAVDVQKKKNEAPPKNGSGLPAGATILLRTIAGERAMMAKEMAGKQKGQEFYNTNAAKEWGDAMAVRAKNIQDLEEELMTRYGLAPDDVKKGVTAAQNDGTPDGIRRPPPASVPPAKSFFTDEAQ